MRGDKELLAELVLGFDGNARIEAVGAVVASQLSTLADEMAALIRSEIAAYAEVTDAAILRSGWQHGLSHAEKIADLLQNKPVGDLTFVEEHATTRADQQFALNDILHTYRIGHRVMWRAVRSAAMTLADEPEDGLRTAMQLADFTIQYTNLISVVLTRAYTQREKSIRNSRARQAHMLFDELMLGRITSQPARMLSDALLLDERDFQVVATHASLTSLSRTMTSPALPAAETLERRLAQPGVDVLVDDRQQYPLILAIYKDPLDASHRRFLTQLDNTVTSNGWHAGISVTGQGVESFSEAYAEAVAALSYCNPARSVTALGDVPLSQLFLDHRHLRFERLLPAWFHELREIDAAADNALQQTIVAFADTDLSVKGAATKLGVHPNTVRFRLEKIRAVTGISPRRFRGMQELLTVIALSAGERRGTLLAKSA